MDGDGDKDMIIATNSTTGTLLYFENTAGVGNTATFVLAQSSLITGVGQYPAPQFVDVNRDGKIDLLVGKRNGAINYYMNTSSGSVVSFSLVTTVFGNVNVAPQASLVGYSVPQLVEEGGIFNLYVGSVSGHIYHYNNIENNLTGVFQLADSSYLDISEGDRVSPAIADLNGDGYLDAVLGNYAGGVSYFKGVNVVSDNSIHAETSLLIMFPNPAQQQLTIKIVNALIESSKQITVYNTLGEIVYHQKINSNNFAIATDSWANGVYFMMMETGNQVTSKKFVVNR